MFNRTSSGISNTHLFHAGYYIVIVEGVTDKPFWNQFFPEEVNGYKKKIKSVGGTPAVQPYIDELLHGKAKFAVAVDSDYRLLLNRLHNDIKIIETKYHSIENLMLHPSSIASIIRSLSYETEYEELLVDDYLNHFDLATHALMVADLAIQEHRIEKQCVGDNCSQFLASKNIPKFDADRIDCFIGNLELPDKAWSKADRKLKGKKSRFHIRGHFLSSFVLRFVSHEVTKIRGKSVSISNDSFYALLISQCESRIAVDPILESIKNEALLAATEVTALLSKTP
jgi:Protein of unknown function (DUF4435)